VGTNSLERHPKGFNIHLQEDFTIELDRDMAHATLFVLPDPINHTSLKTLPTNNLSAKICHIRLGVWPPNATRRRTLFGDKRSPEQTNFSLYLAHLFS
jgi:hypothetical protein